MVGQRSRSRRRRLGLTIIELLICILIIAVVLVELRLQNSQSMESFGRSRDNLSGAWISNLMMNELMSSKLPNLDSEIDGEGDPQALIEGSGNVGEFFEGNFPSVWKKMSERRKEELELWSYRYSKMVFLVSETEQGGPDEEYAPDLSADADDERDVDEEDPDYESSEERLQRPTARIIRIMLVVTPPGVDTDAVPAPSLTEGVPIFGSDDTIPEINSGESEDTSELSDEERSERTAKRRSHIVLIRYIDVENLRGTLKVEEENAGAGGNGG